MSKIEIIKAETEDQIQTYKDMTKYAFSPSPNRSTSDPPPDLGTDYLENSIRYLLLEDEIPVSSLHSIFMSENVRGKIFDMQGIAGVSTYPEARRKGHVKKLMQNALKEGYENGQVVSTLYPFRQSFYGNFGYVNFPQARQVKLSPSNLRDIRNYSFEGDVERHLVGTQIDRFYKFLLKYQETRHGFAIFDRSKEQGLEKSKSWVVFATVNGQDRGMMLFSTTGFEKEIKISSFFYLDSNAKYLLLDHLSRHVDQFSEITLRIFAHEKPETWLYDAKMEISSRGWVPSPMGRILDIGKLGGISVGSGNIVIKITDDNCEWNCGTWKFTANDGKLVVEESTEHDVEMTIQGLSALVYGGYEIDDLYQRGWLSSEQFNSILLELFPPEIPVLWAMF